jgi:calcium-translocating P-type ATPase
MSQDQHTCSWHAASVDRTVSLLGTQPEGLSSDEASRRLDRHGPNQLPEGRRRTLLQRLGAQLNNLLIQVLIAASLLSLLIGHAVDALVILVVVIVNTAIGLVQEGRAEKALEAIRAMIDPRASVVREGRRLTIGAGEVVPGDIVLIEAGDRVPADLRLIRASSLKIQEAVLTGESVAVEKDVAPSPEHAPLGDRHAMAYSGTFIAAGQGAGVAVATGAETELGRVSTMVGAVETLETPLTRQMQRFARQLTIVILGVAAVAFFFAVQFRGYALDEAMMLVVGLAVAAIPEGLPAIMTITLAIGVQRMAGRHAIIRRLPAVETLGSVSIICSDKTGTLTRNEMTATTVLTADDEVAIPGVGYSPDARIDLSGAAEKLAEAALLCNDAELRQSGDAWIADGDPMEGALVTLAMKAGLDPAAERNRSPRLHEIPFDSANRFMATLHQGAIYVKGAPERLFEMCDRERRDGADVPLDRERWEREADRLAARGQRLLAFAVKQTEKSKIAAADLESGAVLLGVVGFIDPPREEARQAIADCHTAGIRVAMITGDHAITAREIARQLGLAENPTTLTGQDLDALTPDELKVAALDTPVFARTSPEHKLRLVTALQADGLTVAMTGDGVNDAPALKRADIGIAMGQKGTEASKEAAEMVLADDNFASIVAAVREGRTVYDNLKKAVAFLLPINGGESLSLLIAVLLGVSLPIEPLQILWVNMVSSVALAFVLAFEPGEPDTMRRPPRDSSEALLSAFVIWRVGLVSTLFMAGIFGMFEYVRSIGGSVELARTAAVNTLVVMEIFYLFSVRYLRTPSFTFVGVKGTPRVLAAIAFVVVLQFAFTFAPLMQTVFRTEAVPVPLGILIVATGPLLLAVLEMEKWARRFAESRRQDRGSIRGQRARRLAH